MFWKVVVKKIAQNVERVIHSVNFETNIKIVTIFNSLVNYAVSICESLKAVFRFHSSMLRWIFLDWINTMLKWILIWTHSRWISFYVANLCSILTKLWFRCCYHRLDSIISTIFILFTFFIELHKFIRSELKPNDHKECIPMITNNVHFLHRKYVFEMCFPEKQRNCFLKFNKDNVTNDENIGKILWWVCKEFISHSIALLIVVILILISGTE